MSTDYFFADPVDFLDLINEAKTAGLQVVTTEESKRRNAVILFNGIDHIWVFRTGGGNAQLTRYGTNDVRDILPILRSAFGPIYSEHEVGHYREEIGG